MTNKFRCRLQIDPPADGAWNMAVDEALLLASLESQVATLRFYQWKQPTLSLGYFQRYEDRTEHLPSIAADVVRRLSGGGAILHDRELTYSLALPDCYPLARDTQALYDAVHTTLVQLLQTSIAGAPVWQAKQWSESARQGPFLCFQRRFVGDILLERDDGTRHKIVGSAQRRRRGAVLQHGSILLAQSEVATELPGIRELTGIHILPDTLLSVLPTALAQSLNLDLTTGAISTELKCSAAEIWQEKYRNPSWTKRT